jgi:hypothetical protein
VDTVLVAVMLRVELNVVVDTVVADIVVVDAVVVAHVVEVVVVVVGLYHQTTTSPFCHLTTSADMLTAVRPIMETTPLVSITG